MSRYGVYNPDQDQLLPASLREELGEGHLAIFVHRLIERLDLCNFEAEHAEAGRPGYPPQLLLKVWLHACALGITSSRRIEQRLHEDLGFRYLARGLEAGSLDAEPVPAKASQEAQRRIYSGIGSGAADGPGAAGAGGD